MPTALALTVPSSIVVDRSLIAPLAGAKNASGYRCIYPHKWGFRAVVKWGGGERRDKRTHKRLPGAAGGGRLRHGPTVHLASVAAYMLALWLRDRLGPQWATIIRSHKRNVWRRHAPFRAWYSEKRKAWLLAVWVQGKREEVLAGDTHRTFATWADAADFAPEYMKEKYGKAWWGMFWRSASSPPAPDSEDIPRGAPPHDQ